MPTNPLFEKYLDLQKYVGWSSEDEGRVRSIAPLVSAHFPRLVDEFYARIQLHPRVARVLRGGAPEVQRLKASLNGWLRELLHGPYDESYVTRRWQVGLRHAAIGLEQVYTNAAMSCLRSGLSEALRAEWRGTDQELLALLQSLHRIIDLDLAVIEEAYENERFERQQRAERSKMEAALHQEKQFADRLIERAQAIVLVLDARGRVLRFNPYLEQLTGFTLREALGQDWFAMFVPASHQQRCRELLLDALRELEISGATTPIVTRAGRQRSIRWSCTLLKDVDGQIVGVLAVGHDITELEEAQQRALQAERLAAIGQMITGLAHESRNALQRIQACAEMLELEVEQNAEALDLVRRIQAAQDHMHRLYEEVRGYASPLQLVCEPIRLSEAWREAWDLLAAQRQGRHARLREEFDEREVEIKGDRFRLVQVFRNLLENSLAACADPVEVLIRCREGQLGEQSAVEILIHDNGPGLDEQQRERIFQPFYTTKTKGTGLGMSIAQRIVEAHQGRIQVDSPEYPGTAIRMTFPR
ncbi:MAG: PAS domain S-box protein [Pirellulaceae bacterium]|nr:PAS domain S-box protein [Pirellulaceae bacterium]